MSDRGGANDEYGNLTELIRREVDQVAGLAGAENQPRRPPESRASTWLDVPLVWVLILLGLAFQIRHPSASGAHGALAFVFWSFADVLIGNLCILGGGIVWSQHRYRRRTRT